MSFCWGKGTIRPLTPRLLCPYHWGDCSLEERGEQGEEEMDVDGGQGTDSLASAPWPCCSNPVSKGPPSGLEERALTEKL